ncbi:MAG: hypothetical protein RRY40_02255 [Oscillospiraceae bacterium]
MKKLKNPIYIAAAVLLVSTALLFYFWFAPFMTAGENNGKVFLLSQDSFIENALEPVLKAGGKAVLKSEKNIEALNEYLNSAENEKIVIDNGDFADSVLSVVGDFDQKLKLVLLNPTKAPKEAKINENTEILILGDAGGALKTDETAIAVYNLLTSSRIEPNGRPMHTKKAGVDLIISPAPMLLVATPSFQVLENIYHFATSQSNTPFSLHLPQVKLLLSISAIISLLFLAIILAVKYNVPHEFPDGIVAAEVKSNLLFFLSRGILIICSALFSLLVLFILGIFDSLHSGGLLFLSYFIGCSLTTKIFYHFGMLGIKGKPLDIKAPLSTKGIFLSVGVLGAQFICGIALWLGGFWKLHFGFKSHLMMISVFLLLSFGFISVIQDFIILQKTVKTQSSAIALLLFPYIPVFAIAAVYIPLGEFYLSMAVVKLIIFAVISLLTAKIVREITGSVFFATAGSAFCLSFFTCYQMYI